MTIVGRVLIADRDDAIRKRIGKALTLAGVPHDAAGDARSAIELLERQECTVLLLDLLAADASAILEWLQASLRRPRLILGMIERGPWRANVSSRLVTAVIRKPFDLRELTLVLRDAAQLLGWQNFPSREEEVSRANSRQVDVNSSSPH